MALVEASENTIGFMRFAGPGIEDGVLGARQQAVAIANFDSAVRSYVSLVAPDIQHLEYELPVFVSRGSYLLELPQLASDWIKIAAAAYATSAAIKIAQNDFSDVNSREILKNAIGGLQWFVRISRHVRSTAKKNFTGIKWSNDGEWVHLPNNEGKFFAVPKQQFDWYLASPGALISGLCEIIDANRYLEICVYEEENAVIEKITNLEREIFFADPTIEEILFPELEHGQPFDGTGYVTRGNESANSIGFRYCEHILTCYPTEGNIRAHRNELFRECRMQGMVMRRIDSEEDANRPRILFHKLTAINPDSEPELF